MPTRTSPSFDPKKAWPFPPLPKEPLTPAQELKLLGYELSGVLADIKTMGLGSFDNTCLRTLKRVQRKMMEISKKLEAESSKK